jgi:hypothetical protein
VVVSGCSNNVTAEELLEETVSGEDGSSSILGDKGPESCKWVFSRLRPSRKFLEKFKIIFFTNFSRNYFREIREVIFLEFLYFDFIFHVFRVR